MKNLNIYIDLVNNASEHITYNTLEIIFNRLDDITAENMTQIQNFNALLLQAEHIEKDNIKNMVVNKLTNQLEQLVSQL